MGGVRYWFAICCCFSYSLEWFKIRVMSLWQLSAFAEITVAAVV